MIASEAAFGTLLAELGRALVALAPYREDLVLAGGIVPLLYRRVAGFREPGHPPLMTVEADVSVPPRLPLKAGRTISDLLLDASFTIFEAPGLDPRRAGPQYFQDARFGSERAAPTYIELLTPLRGPPREGLVEPQPGVRAQPLRYLDLLAYEPLTLDAQLEPALGISEPCPVRLPQPTMYVLQKVLARSSGRVSLKQPKDLAYIYDVAVLTQPTWNTLGAVVARARAESPEWARWIDKALRQLDVLFASETTDGVVEVTRVYRDVIGSRAPSERAVHRVVRGFIDALGAAAP